MPATILGEHYQITATAEGYASATATDIVVADNAVTVVAPDAADPATPTALLLQPINGDFDLCAVSQVGGCTPISFSNQNSVRVHLRDDNGVTRVRAAAGALPSEATLPLTAYDDDLGVVIALPDTQGNIAIFADVERDGARASGVAFCSNGVACTVLLPSLAGVVAEQRHDLFAFVCDAAGNCSTTAGRSAVVFDNTPPSALNGVGFAPTGSAIVGSRPRFRTRSGAYAVAIDVGEAASKDGVPVVDIAGDPVRDVDAVALSFVAAIDDDDADSLVGADLPGAQAVIAGLPLLGGEADYDVFARFIDAAGNATAIEPNPFGFTLTLDETAPTGRLDFAGGANITNSRTVAAAVINLSETGTLAKLVADAGSTATALSCAASTGYVAFSTSVAVSVALADPSGAATSSTPASKTPPATAPPCPRAIRSSLTPRRPRSPWCSTTTTPLPPAARCAARSPPSTTSPPPLSACAFRARPRSRATAKASPPPARDWCSLPPPSRAARPSASRSPTNSAVPPLTATTSSLTCRPPPARSRRRRSRPHRR